MLVETLLKNTPSNICVVRRIFQKCFDEHLNFLPKTSISARNSYIESLSVGLCPQKTTCQITETGLHVPDYVIQPAGISVKALKK